MEYLLSEKPSLKERITDFFTGASKKYAFESQLSSAAQKWLKQYKKLFDRVAEKNKSTASLVNATERVAYTAYELGRKSSENGESNLNSLSNNGIINTSKSEAKNESGESIHLRNGGKRDGGKDTQGQVSRMEGGSGQTESRRKAAKVADSEAARLVNEGREVKVADLGILGGSTEQTVRLVDKENETSSMKEARKRAEERGLKVTFFVGDNLVIKDKSGEWISARAYIKGDHVFVRADHPLYTADQLMRHELGHDMIAKGEVDIEAVRERLEETVGKDKIDEVAEHYADAYAGSGLSAEAIWEECICDSLGDMNIFAGNKAVGTFLDQMLPEIKKSASESKSPTQTRGSPDGKASRETYTKAQYNNFGWVRANEVVSKGYWNNFTRNFAEAINNKNFDRISDIGEYMIEVYDESLSESQQIIDHIVFAKGNLRNPKITRIIQINLQNETKLSDEREFVYALEREGLRTEADDILKIYTSANARSASSWNEFSGSNAQDLNKLGTERGRGSKAASRVKEYIFEVEESEVSGKASRALDSQYSSPEEAKASGKASRELDTEYLDAVNRGDMETAQRMVDEAAKEAGYKNLFYHGSKRGGGFTVFKDWQYFTENKQYAERYTERDNKGSLYTTYVKLDNPFDTRKAKDKKLFESIRQEYGLSEIQDTGLPDWTDGYDISDYIDENELDYDGIILDEGGDFVDGKPVSRGFSYVVRKSAQIKSADPVTYDDDGNVIPLSERFNTKNSDIRFSLMDSTETSRDLVAMQR